MWCQVLPNKYNRSLGFPLLGSNRARGASRRSRALEAGGCATQKTLTNERERGQSWGKGGMGVRG